MWRLVGVAVGVGALLGCGNACSYWERCGDDATLLVCGAGVDQQFGRTVHEYPCGEANPICVEEGDAHAACVAATTCDTSEPARCDGTTLTTCGEAFGAFAGSLEGPYLVVTDCVALMGEGATCETSDDGTARCQAP